MLTEQQISQLQPLTQHPKYGKLLLDAIEIWKQPNVTVCYNYSGIAMSWDPETYEDLNILTFDDPENPKCDLIGAVVANVKMTEDMISGTPYMFSVCSKLYNLSIPEIEELFWGFDGDRDEEDNFGMQVRQIVKPIWMER